METSTGNRNELLSRRVAAATAHVQAMKRLRRAVNACKRASRAASVASDSQIAEQREAAEWAYWTLHRFAEATFQTPEHFKEWWYVYTHRI